jgi:hypothetical protein
MLASRPAHAAHTQKRDVLVADGRRERVRAVWSARERDVAFGAPPSRPVPHSASIPSAPVAPACGVTPKAIASSSSTVALAAMPPA